MIQSEKGGLKSSYRQGDGSIDHMSGTLYLVSLPIGNLEDMTIRAIRTLRAVDAIVAEDTRTTQRILDRYAIRTPFFSSLYQGAERARLNLVLDRLRDGADLALVSDAGTPLVSDPGFPLVRSAVEAGIRVSPVPGPSALLAGLVASGFPLDQFRFGGALPRKAGDRASQLAQLDRMRYTSVFYESPHRLLETLRMLAEILPDRRVVLARELTKVHETFLRGTPTEILSAIGPVDRVKGECVLLIDGASEVHEDIVPPRATEVRTLLRDAGLPKRSIVDVLVLALGMRRNDAYRFAHDTEETDDSES